MRPMAKSLILAFAGNARWHARMRPMAKSLHGFRATLAIGWMALGAAGALYARTRGVPIWAAAPALAAFLVEYAFYLVPAFPTVRERLAGWRLPPFLVAGAVLPYRWEERRVGEECRSRWLPY